MQRNEVHGRCVRDLTIHPAGVYGQSTGRSVMSKLIGRIAVTAVFCVMLFLCACSQSAGLDTGKIDEAKSKIEEKNAASAQDAGSEKKSTKKKKKDEKKESNGFFADAFAEGNVENNGGMFVKVGNRVYYRMYNTRAVSFTTLDRPCIDEVRSDLPSVLMYYDLDTDKSVTVCEVCGIGPLYATVDGICLDSYPDGSPSTTLIDENGKTDEHYLSANITGVSADGSCVSVGESDENDDIIPVLFSEGKRVGTPADNGEPDRYYTSYGFVGNEMIGVTSKVGSNIKELFSYDGNGKLTILGQIGHYDMETYTLSPNVEDVVSTSDGGMLITSYRDGTADAVVAWAAFSFVPGKEDSLSEYESDLTGARFGFAPPKVATDHEGKVRLTAQPPGKVYLSEGTYGDLVCTDKDGDEVVLRENYIAYDGEEMQHVTAIEGGICFSCDAAFLIEASGERFPDEDAGIHRAYELNTLKFECVRFDDAHLDDDTARFSWLGDLYSAGWDKGDIEYDRLVGEWKAYYLEVEGEVQDVDHDTPMIRFNEDGSAVTYYKESAGGKISRERKLHRGEPDEYMSGSDYAYVYYTDDEDPLRAGICYLSHNKLSIFYLYHFDGNSTGWYTINYHKTDK